MIFFLTNFKKSKKKGGYKNDVSNALFMVLFCLLLEMGAQM